MYRSTGIPYRQSSELQGRILVIGATSDYIAAIQRNHPERAVFVTDPAERQRSAEPVPGSMSELLCALDDPLAVLTQIRCHLTRFNLQAIGLACFDCEALHLTSLLAAELGLPYPAPEAVLTSRSKFLSKLRWQQAGLDCPAAQQIACPDEAVAFMQHNNGRIILKPLTGSGSELIFLCTTTQEVAAAFAVMTSRLTAMPAERMYAPYQTDGLTIDPHTRFIVEEYCEGIEYSADFLITGAGVELIRVARKLLKPDPFPGTVMAYQLPEIPALDHKRLREHLAAAAISLGINQSICMADFLMADERLILLELTPRPGGDCLPPLLRAAQGLDILGLTLDVAEGLPVQIPGCKPEPLVGLRLFAPLPGGVIEQIDCKGLLNDPRVQELQMIRRPGYRVIHPPDDYQSRILGYALFKPFLPAAVEQECLELLDKLIVTYAGEASR